MAMQVGASAVKSASCEKFVIVTINVKLTFDKHIKTVCQNESNKLTSSLKISD